MDAWDALLRAMRTARGPRPRRIGAREAERLLTGAPVGPDRRELVHLLGAAAGPARPDELVGGDAALAAFRAQAARSAVASRSRKGRRLLPLAFTAKLGVKVAVAAAVLSVGGAAWAAETGNLPVGVQRAAHGLFSSLGVPAPAGSATPAETHRRGTASPAPRVVPASDPPVSADPAMRGLCRTFTEHRQNHGKPLNPGQTRKLADAAGGEVNIAQYCAGLLAEPPTATATPQPDPAPDNPTGTGHGNGHGHGHGPTDRPTHH